MNRIARYLRGLWCGLYRRPVLLFLSMLPLHADDEARQWALLANALRLHRRLDSGRAA